jgi:hypothetical protein
MSLTWYDFEEEFHFKMCNGPELKARLEEDEEVYQ